MGGQDDDVMLAIFKDEIELRINEGKRKIRINLTRKENISIDETA